MKQTHSKVYRTGLSCFVSVVVAGSAIGQSRVGDATTDEQIFELNPFEVTSDPNSGYYGTSSVGATRTRTDLSNLAMSIQVLTADFIEDSGANELIDVVTYASGVTEAVSGTSGTKDDDDNTSFTLRGVGTYLPMRNGFRRLRLVSGDNIQQVEILKGPASLLYGQLAPGGTVNYITKQARANETFGSFTAAIGDYSFKKAVLDYNQVLRQDQLAFRVVGSILDVNPIEDRYERTATLFNPTLAWTPTNKTKLMLDYEISTRDSTAPTGNVPWADEIYILDQPGALDRTFNTRVSSDYIDTTMTNKAVELVHEFNENFTGRMNVTESVWEMDKRFNSGSSKLDINTRLVGNRSLQYRLWGSWDNFRVAELVNNFRTENIQVQNLFGFQHAELQFRNRYTGRLAPGVSNPSERWNLDDPSTWVLTELTEADTVVNTGATGNKSTNLNTSYYFTNQLTMLDNRLHTLLGVRHEKLDTKFYRASTGELTVTEAEDATVPQFGALYKLTDNVSVYASYSESFNPAFATLRDENGDFFTPTPEAGEGYDLGLKANIPEARISLSAAIFTIDRSNIIRALPPMDDPDSPGSTFNPSRQSGVERSEGFEMDMRWTPTESTQMIMSYGYTDARVVSDEQSPEANEGHALAHSPRNIFSFFVKQDLRSIWFFEKTYFTVGARANSSREVTSSWYRDENGEFRPPASLPGYEVVDLGLGGTFTAGEREVDVRLNVKNAFDEVYLAHRFAFGDPRTVQLSFKTKF